MLNYFVFCLEICVLWLKLIGLGLSFSVEMHLSDVVVTLLEHVLVSLSYILGYSVAVIALCSKLRQCVNDFHVEDIFVHVLVQNQVISCVCVCACVCVSQD